VNVRVGPYKPDFLCDVDLDAPLAVAAVLAQRVQEYE
jgi:hypothetical protein